MATRAILRRLRLAGRIATPYQGFHVIVRPEYQSLGCLPPDQFIDTLMRHIGEKYYVALLSAAELHGAAHQRPQLFYVAVSKARPIIECGRVQILFIKHARIETVAAQQMQNDRGYFCVSTPEATAIDLVAFAKRSAGLGNVATVLAELAEKIEEAKLVQQASLWAEPPWVQRLGYLLEVAGANDLAAALAAWVEERRPRHALLEPRRPGGGSRLSERWRLWINADVEVDE